MESILGKIVYLEKASIFFHSVQVVRLLFEFTDKFPNFDLTNKPLVWDLNMGSCLAPVNCLPSLWLP